MRYSEGGKKSSRDARGNIQILATSRISAFTRKQIKEVSFLAKESKNVLIFYQVGTRLPETERKNLLCGNTDDVTQARRRMIFFKRSVKWATAVCLCRSFSKRFCVTYNNSLNLRPLLYGWLSERIFERS